MSDERHVQSDKRQCTHYLEGADRQRDQALTIVAHELSSPLAAVAYSAELLRRRETTLEVREKAAAIILEQTEFMRRLVEDLRELSGVWRGNTASCNKALINLAQVAHDAVEMSRPLIERRGHALEIVVPRCLIRIRGDRVRLVQIVTNLLMNAARYSPERGHIRLSIEQETASAVLKVKDDGIGIPKDMLTGIFDLFTRLEDAKRKYAGGMGIGLALVRHLVQIHGGSVEAFSEGEGHGSEFIVRLPLAEDIPLNAIDVTALKQGHYEGPRDAEACAMVSLKASADICLEPRSAPRLMHASASSNHWLD